MESRDKILKERIEHEFTMAKNARTGRIIFACPDDMWLLACAAHSRCGDVPEPFPEGHIIFEGKCVDWEIIAGQMVMGLQDE